MNDEQLKQRIAYLVEHGGMYDDPWSDIKRLVRWAIGVSAGALLLGLINLAI